MYSTFDLIMDTEPVAEIVLTAQKKHNALSAAFWSEFPEAIKAVDANPSIRALIIRSNGPNFSAGMALDFFDTVYAKQNEEQGRFREWLRREILRLQQAVTLLEDIRVPVIAVTQGACIGGALDLLCATNIRVATQDAYFSIHEINIGMTADLGTLQRLPKLIPMGVVQEMALMGTKLDAVRARALGFVADVCVSHDDAVTRAREIAALIAEKSPLAVTGTKIALNHGRDHTIPEGLQQAANWNAGMFISEDLTLGIDAQKNRKAAVYKDTLPL